MNFEVDVDLVSPEEAREVEDGGDVGVCGNSKPAVSGPVRGAARTVFLLPML